ncbi:hypothetical protein TWF730_000317 [Orbilia blumenaviensis]|uniref:Uncharacterized protein n=1 Tax=Orbilia blumenaviensis TaxID=1796055 RepID=A0AAV9VSC4_9PEZI
MEFEQVVLPIHELSYHTDKKKSTAATTIILNESLQIIEVDTVVVPVSNSTSNRKSRSGAATATTTRSSSNHGCRRRNSKPKSNVSQHPASNSWSSNLTQQPPPPPEISAIAQRGHSLRLSFPHDINTNRSSRHVHNDYDNNNFLTQTNGYALSTLQNHYTPPSPTLEAMFMEATSCRSSQPGVETLVSVYNYVKGHKHPNGLYPPYQLGVSGDEGVLSIYRSYKEEDLNFCDAASDGSGVNDCSSGGSGSKGKNGEGKMGRDNRVWWSDIMHEVWRRYSPSSTPSSTSNSRYLRTRSSAVPPQPPPRLRFVAIPEVNNEEVKMVANYAFEKKGLDKERDALVVDWDDEKVGSGEGWSFFDAFLGTASVKAIHRMATDHADELGYIVPARVYIKYSRFEYPNIGEVLLPNLLVEMRRERV